MKKHNILLLSFLMVPFIGALAADKNPVKQPSATDTVVVAEKPLYEADQMPQFPGGEKELMNYITKNLHYPKKAAEAKKEGRVVLRFVVGKDGKVGNIECLRGFDPECDQEAIRVLNAMPTWIPGIKNGVAVPVYYTFPFRFQVGKDKTNSLDSITNLANKPLVIVDGVEKTTTPNEVMALIGSENIESVTILKDAKAEANFGDKGKNGVVIIKTKKK